MSLDDTKVLKDFTSEVDEKVPAAHKLAENVSPVFLISVIKIPLVRTSVTKNEILTSSILGLSTGSRIFVAIRKKLPCQPRCCVTQSCPGCNCRNLFQ